MKCEPARFESDTSIIEECRLPLTHRLDTTSQPGAILIRERTAAEIEELQAAVLAAKRHVADEDIKLRTGDKAPDLSLRIVATGENLSTKGRCCLVTFWAFWCGNCLKELQEEYLPSIAAKFLDRDDFIFIPICIDADLKRVEEFVHGEGATRWPTLSAHTALDSDRSLNALFATPGLMPLNIVIGRDGTIRLLRCGSITTSEQLSRLETAIEQGLKQ